MVYRLIQLSDIHFGQERDGSVHVHTDVREKLIDDAEQFVNTHGKADLLLISGDIAYSGKSAEYKEAGKWLDLLTERTKCETNAVRMVPGNHDCDRGLITRFVKSAHREMRDGTVKSAYAYLDDIYKSDEEASSLINKLKAYRDFSASYESDFSSIAKPLWIKKLPFPNGIDIHLIGMNSVQVCDDEDKSGNMILGNSQYIIKEFDNVIPVVVVHHPLDWYKDKSDIKPYFYNRAKVILVGHEHIADLSKSTSANGVERLEIYAGATNPPEDDEGKEYKYTYNWLELSLTEEAGCFQLSVIVYPRVWVKESTCFRADTLRLEGNESALFKIACPKVKVSTVQRVKEHQDNAMMGATECVVVSSAASCGGAMLDVDDAAFSKLKFLFWRYLEWDQRLKALVEADVLPPTAEKPIPQTIERLAIDNARKTGKLSSLWDATMKYVPEEKRQENPFNKKK
jgi:3',5'-cyclic AMP phosphodiesterase CpdA